MRWFMSFVLLCSTKSCISQTTTFCDRQIINTFCARYESDLRYICRKTVVLITDGATVCDEKGRCATLDDLQCLKDISKGTRVSRVPLPSVPSIISTNDGSFLRDVNSVNLLRLNLPPILTTTTQTPTPVLTNTPTPTPVLTTTTPTPTPVSRELTTARHPTTATVHNVTESSPPAKSSAESTTAGEF
jgi:hypothetical protein